MKSKFAYLIIGFILILFSWYLVKNAVLRAYYCYQEPASEVQIAGYKTYLADEEKLRLAGSPGMPLKEIILSLCQLKETVEFNNGNRSLIYTSEKLTDYIPECWIITSIRAWEQGDLIISYISLDGREVSLSYSDDACIYYLVYTAGFDVYTGAADVLYSHNAQTPEERDIIYYNYRKGNP